MTYFVYASGWPIGLPQAAEPAGQIDELFKFLGAVGIALCYVAVALIGWAIGGRSLGVIPRGRFMLLPLIWAALLVPLAVGRLNLDVATTTGPAVMVTRLAAALVSAITGTAPPICSLSLIPI